MIRAYGWTKGDKEWQRDFENVTEMHEWADAHGADVSGFGPVTDTRPPADDAAERKFADACFNYQRGRKSS